MMDVFFGKDREAFGEVPSAVSSRKSGRKNVFGFPERRRASGYAAVKRGHFRFNTISVLTVLLFLILGLFVQEMVFRDAGSVFSVYMIAGALMAAALLALLTWWPVVLAVTAAFWAVPMALGELQAAVSLALTLGFLLAPGFEVVAQWDKVVVLRLGHFHRVKGPGLIFLLPLIDTVAGYVDTRIRASDFSAEKSITLDTVPVHIDALAFWMIWDAQKAVMEVQDFEQAVVLSAQTALRSVIGSNSLTSLLSDRERMAGEIRKIIDAKTEPWGITILSVEFKEVIVPGSLEDLLSREAQAERESRSRKILSRAEADIAANYSEAAALYRDDPVALQLRGMSMVYESMRNRGGLVLTPSSALESMNLGTVLGAAAYSSAAAGGAGGEIPRAAAGGPDAVLKSAAGIGSAGSTAAGISAAGISADTGADTGAASESAVPNPPKR